MLSQWVMQKGQRYFLANYARLAPEAFAQEAQAVIAEVVKQPPQSVRLMVDVEGLLIGPRQLDILRNGAVQFKPAVRKVAVLGVTGAKKAMLDLVLKISGLDGKAFETRAQAETWLFE